MDGASILESRETKHQSHHHTVGIERARSDASYLLYNLSKRRCDNLGEILTPDFPLEILEGLEILRGLQRANTHAIVSGVGSAGSSA